MAKLTNFKGFTLGFVIVALQLFMFISASDLFGPDAEYWKGVILAYMVMEALVFAVADLRLKAFNVPAGSGLVRMAIAFFITIAILGVVRGGLVLSGFSSPAESLSSFGLVLIAVHLFIIAYIEEVVWRDYAAEKIGILPAAIGFGVFHGTVYQWSMGMMVMAIIMGLLFYYIKQRFSPKDNTVNAGVHGGWNSWALGLGETVLKAVGIQ